MSTSVNVRFPYSATPVTGKRRSEPVAAESLESHTERMTQTMSTYEVLPISDGSGGEFGTVALDLDEDGYITLTVADEETEVGLGLTVDEAKALIALLAVKVAQHGMRG
jgi:hypothetical protein